MKMDQTDRYRESRKLFERAQRSLTGGVGSPFRAKFPAPLYFQSGCGPRVMDSDCNQYIDYALAWGPLILGHCHPRLVAAMQEQASKPHIYGAQHEREFLVAEKIQSMVPCAQRVLLTSSGTEAIQIALRLARAYTGRNLILRFEGHYHGWVDSVLLSYRASLEQLGPAVSPNAILGSKGQTPNAADNVIVAAWNDAESLSKLFAEHGHNIAAVITEPVLCNSGCLMPDDGYLEQLRTIAHENGSLVIFDEVITGFRISPGGAQQHFGVTPDIATFGKAVAGGLAMSAIVGRQDIMEQVVKSGVVFGGTFNSNPIATAAAAVTLDVLSQADGAALAHANRIGDMLMSGIRDAAAAADIPAQVTGLGAAFAIHFTRRTGLKSYRDTFEDDREMLDCYLKFALDEGLFLLPDGRVYVSAVHAEREVEETLDAIGRVMRRLQ
jgi:glutamate-1-semialdehyde 2,1-aminomutase